MRWKAHLIRGLGVLLQDVLPRLLPHLISPAAHTTSVELAETPRPRKTLLKAAKKSRLSRMDFLALEKLKFLASEIASPGAL